MTVRSFTELIVWQRANDLRKLIYALTKKFPDDERFNLVNQLRRAAFSIAANIAEGFGRFHFRENMQYCRQARGSLEEVLDGVIFSCEMGYIDSDSRSIAERNIDECRKLLNAYIKSIGTSPNDSPKAFANDLMTSD